MAIADFKRLLLAVIAAHFPTAGTEILQRRTTILQARVSIDEKTLRCEEPDVQDMMAEMKTTIDQLGVLKS